MKKSKLFLLALLAVLTFSSCGDEDNYLIVNGGNNSGSNTNGNTGGNTGGNTPGESTDANNTNKNVATASMPAIVAQSIGRLEFPKVKGETSYVVVHQADGDVNFSTEWDDNLHSQRWTCYTYTAANRVNNNVGRTGAFINDPDLKSLYGITDLTTIPYSIKNCDRGHMIASHERQASRTANAQTFYFTNMQPQYSKFNQEGVWSKMEAEMRNWTISNTKDTIFIVKGGTIDNGNIITYAKGDQTSATQKDGYIPIPKYFFTAILRKLYNTKNNSFDYLAYGYWFEHKDEAFNSADNLSNYIVNIDELEQKTGIDFFCNLPDVQERELQSASKESIKSALGKK